MISVLFFILITTPAAEGTTSTMPQGRSTEEPTTGVRAKPVNYSGCCIYIQAGIQASCFCILESHFFSRLVLFFIIPVNFISFLVQSCMFPLMRLHWCSDVSRTCDPFDDHARTCVPRTLCAFFRRVVKLLLKICVSDMSFNPTIQ